MSAVRPAAMHASLTTPPTAARTKTDWSNSSETFSSFGRRVSTDGSIARTRSVTSSVLAWPSLRIGISAAFLPCMWTMFVCGALPSRTLAMSRM